VVDEHAPELRQDATTGDASADDLDALGLTPEERAVLAKVVGVIRRINYGTVVLVIQDGKVVQIEMAEKFRLR
jgi:hypothetical protein